MNLKCKLKTAFSFQFVCDVKDCKSTEWKSSVIDSTAVTIFEFVCIVFENR